VGAGTRVRPSGSRYEPELKPAYRHLVNKAMARELSKGRCIDLADCTRTALDDYLLPAGVFRKGMDYCDSREGVWIHSIARIKRPLGSKLLGGENVTLLPGAFLASRTTRFHGMNIPALECVWLR